MAKKKAKKKTTKKRVAKKVVKKKVVKKAAKKKAVKKKAVKKKATKKATQKVPAKGKAGQVDQKARKAILKEVKEDGYALEHADKNFKADREVVLAAVKQDGNALQYADKSLKADREIVFAAVKQYGHALDYADKSLKADREFMLKAVKQYCWVLEYAAKSIKADREILLAAVKQDGDLLSCASKDLQRDNKLRKLAGKEILLDPKVSKKESLISFFDSQNQSNARLAKIYVCWNQISEKEYCSGTYTFEDGTSKEGQSWNNNVIGGCLEFGQGSNFVDTFEGLVETLKGNDWLKYQDTFADFDGRGKSIDYEFDEYAEYCENTSDDCELDIPDNPSHFDFLLFNKNKELKFRFESTFEQKYKLCKFTKTNETDITGSNYSVNDISKLIKHLTKQL